jgi:uncharacterized membrane protein
MGESGRSRWYLAGAALAVAGVATWQFLRTPSQDAGPVPGYTEARAIVDRHCVGCHSAHPVEPAFPIAPGGVRLDTAGEMQRHAARILARTVVDPSMPLLNRSGMTAEERRTLGAWVEGGARLQ